MITNEVKIPVGKIKPLFLRSSFLDIEGMDDVLGLSEMVHERFRNFSSKGKEAPLIFIDTKKFHNARYVNGLYSIAEGKVTLKVKLFGWMKIVGRKILMILKLLKMHWEMH